jgi:pyruvate kinase
LSFLTKIEQLNNFKKIILDNKYHPFLIGKIENYTAMKNIDSLIENCDSIMVARGDLATETSYELIPEYQNIIVEKCLIAKKPVIIATEILASCERNLRPTRAEVTDAYFAITSDVDALMLSGETANGVDPINAVKILKTIIDKYDKPYSETKGIDEVNFEILKSNRNIFYILEKIDLKKENKYFLYKNIESNF